MAAILYFNTNKTSDSYKEGSNKGWNAVGHTWMTIETIPIGFWRNLRDGKGTTRSSSQ